MKVEIERAIFDLEMMPQIMKMIDVAKKSETLSDFLLTSTNAPNIHLLSFGRAGSHAWVSDCKGKRILLITE